METIEIKPMTSIEDAVKKVLEIAEQTNHPIIAKFNDFLINSEYGYDKNIDLYYVYKAQPENNNSINWEQRRYEIAKEMLHDCVEYFDDIQSLIDEDKRVEFSTELAIKYADALINKLKLRKYS
jgi:hypothetical protein|nr:MAG TPA_asm: hypothetical protein [Caudoviricetes sp.]